MYFFREKDISQSDFVYCAQDAKLCSDGSYVSRTGPKCEFAPCPKEDLILVESPKPGEEISSPLLISGQARGFWFFEASFPVILVDWDGKIIAQDIATAKSDPDATDGAGWMTSEFVPFEAIITFTADKNAHSNKGTLILRKDNPSGLPEHDDALEIPVVFDGVAGNTPSPPIACAQEQRNVDACAEIYAPVCATVQIQCIKAPCYPIKQTFGNSCEACRDQLTSWYVPGECKKELK